MGTRLQLRQLARSSEALSIQDVAASVDVGAQILQARVGHERDHRGTRPQTLCHLNCRDDVRSGRYPGEEALLAREAPRHFLRIVCFDWQDVIHERRIPKRWNVANANSFYLVRPGLPP